MVEVAQLAPDPADETQVLARLDLVAHQLTQSWEATGQRPSPAGLLSFVHGTLGFRGDTEGYYHPSNSFIHRVLERRVGIPLTLAAIDTEVGRRVGVDLTIVGLPGHVILGDGPQPQRWFDPFAGGPELGVEDCRQIFARFQPIERFDAAMLQPISPITFTTRMLANLRNSYYQLGDISQLIKVMTASANLPEAPLDDRLELARVLAAFGREARAAEEFELLAAYHPDEAERFRATARGLRARNN